MSTGLSHYRSYLLRLWRVPCGVNQSWRASLEDTLTGQRTGFPDLEVLCAFLRLQNRSAPWARWKTWRNRDSLLKT